MIRSAVGYSKEQRSRTPRLVSSTIIATYVIVACIALSSCSPYVYSSDVQTMSTQTSAIDASYQQMASAITSQQYQNSRYEWIKQKTALARDPGCGLHYTGSVACELVSAPPGPTLIDPPNTAPSPPPADVCQTPSATNQVTASSPPTKQKPPTTAEYLKALDNYTAALAAITRAQDRADFDAAAAKLSAAVGGLAQTAGPYGAAAAPIAKASINIALWLVGQGLDYQRLEELRIATRAACEPFHVVTHALALALDDQRGLRLSGLDEWSMDKVQTANTVRTTPHVSDQALGTAIDNAQLAVATFETVRTSNPTATMRALSDAHDALVVAVRNNDGEIGALITNLQTLTQQAQALAAAAAPPSKKS
jgi:hypothetical protein